MGVLPLQFQPGVTAASLGLTGSERYEVIGIAQSLKPGGLITVRAVGAARQPIEFQAIARIDTPEELVAFRHGGILPYVLAPAGWEALTLARSMADMADGLGQW